MKFQKGFTLIEMVVAAAIFATVVTSIIGIYLAASHLDTRSRAIRTVVQNGRFIMEFLEKEVTNGRIDYTKANDSTNIYLINQGGEEEHIFLSAHNLVLEKNAITTNINSASVEVVDAQFAISPSADPFTPAKAKNEQPHVTVFLHFQSRSSRDKADLNLQDTFSELYYPSRQ